MQKRIFFAGLYRGENGPAEVNKNIVSYLPNDVFEKQKSVFDTHRMFMENMQV